MGETKKFPSRLLSRLNFFPSCLITTGKNIQNRFNKGPGHAIWVVCCSYNDVVKTSNGAIPPTENTAHTHLLSYPHWKWLARIKYAVPYASINKKIVEPANVHFIRPAQLVLNDRIQLRDAVRKEIVRDNISL